MNRLLAALGAVLVLFAGAIGLGQVPPAPADGSGSEALTPAEQQYLEAQEHYKARRYTEALVLFRQLVADQGSPNARLYVARCLREQGQLALAYEQMERTARDAAARVAAEPRFTTTRDVAQGELAELAERVGFVELRPSSRPVGLEVEVNGRILATAQLAAPVAVQPERVRVHARAPGYQPFNTELLVTAATTVLVPIVLRPAGAAAPAPVPTPTATGPVAPALPPTAPAGEPPAPDAAAVDDGDDGDDGGTSGLVAGGITLVGLGVVGWITFAVAGTLADDRFEEIEQTCGGQRCTDPALNDAIDEGRVMDIVANAGLGVGVVGFALAGVLFAVELASDDEPAQPAERAAARVELRAWGSPTATEVGIGGTF